MNEFEYNQALPSFTKYVSWYRTCRKYNIPETELNFATTLLDADKYDPKEALLLMSEYNDTVCNEDTPTMELECTPVHEEGTTKYVIMGAICGVIGSLMGMIPLFIFIVNAF